MHYLNEEHLLTFLVQLLVLLALAKILGEWCQRRGIPALAGEILTGILLGPTILGRAWPGLQSRLFPSESIQPNMAPEELHQIVAQGRHTPLIHGLIQQDMLETASWFGVLFLLLATGFEVNISTVWKQGKTCLTIGLVGVIIPAALGMVVFWWLPETYWGINADRLTFSAFLAIAVSISAIPVVAKLLHDMEVLKSDFGLTTLSAFVVNDVIGWIAFTLVLSIAAPSHGGSEAVSRVFFDIVLFGTVCLTIGSTLVGSAISWLQKKRFPQPGTTLSFIFCLGLLCGAVTQWIGIHAILGFFLAGIMAGNAPEISENTRQTISQVIHAIFVPLFFATIGIKVDFFANFDILMVVLVTAVAVGGKFVGAWLGALKAGLPKSEAFSTGAAHIPGGAMEIVVGLLALEFHLISEPVFVAVVFAAVLSSVLVGPLLAWSLRRGEDVDTGAFLLRQALILDLKGRDRWSVLPEMCTRVAQAVDELNFPQLLHAIRKREEITGTGLEKGVAVPHARLENLRRPVVAFGRSYAGIDWDARDGLPVHFVFLILTPVEEEGIQVQALGTIARVMTETDVPEAIMAAENADQAFQILKKALCSGTPPTPAPVSDSTTA